MPISILVVMLMDAFSHGAILRLGVEVDHCELNLTEGSVVSTELKTLGCVLIPFLLSSVALDELFSRL